MANLDSELTTWSKTILEQGLNLETVTLHRRRLLAALKNQSKPEFKIIDTCRLDNGGLMPANWLNSSTTDKVAGYAAFVPAAGAASRYLDGLSENEIEKLLSLLDPKQQELASDDTLVKHPKAFFPCTPGGPSFLEMKCLEHDALQGMTSQIFVAPYGQRAAFAEACKSSSSSSLQTHILEQDMQLSTLRFTADGKPVTEDNGALSVVPAGHGMLIELFPLAKQKSPAIHSLLIRNIDNVSGTHERVRTATTAFLATHQTLLNHMRTIRTALKQKQVSAASDIATSLLQTLPVKALSAQQKTFLAACEESSLPLWQLQIQLFGLDPDTAQKLWPEIPSAGALAELYSRPLNILGQVPNSGKDVGGTPVWAHTPRGEVRICLELPHASDADRKAFLANPAKATHFNPVFVAAEIDCDLSSYKDSRDIFWIMAHKHFQQSDVYYHETVLYELLGNSLLANSVFMEIPRFLFNPHKSHKDTLTHKTSDWLASKS